MMILSSHRPEAGMWPVLPVSRANGLTQGDYVIVGDVDGH